MALAWSDRVLTDELDHIKALTDALLTQLPLIDSHTEFSKHVSIDEALTKPLHGCTSARKSQS